MNSFEFNKLAASILVAGLVAMVVGSVTDVIYEPKLTPEKRGFQVAVTETSDNQGEAKQEAPQEIKIGQLMAAANAEIGKEISKKCATCHSFDKGGPNLIGPNLWNVVGAKLGHSSGFAYSQALIAKGGEWTYENLYHFMNSPKKFINGTKMSFIGLKKPEEIANVIAYLRSLSDSPKALPSIEK